MQKINKKSNRIFIKKNICDCLKIKSKLHDMWKSFERMFGRVLLVKDWHSVRSSTKKSSHSSLFSKRWTLSCQITTTFKVAMSCIRFVICILICTHNFLLVTLFVETLHYITYNTLMKAIISKISYHHKWLDLNA